MSVVFRVSCDFGFPLNNLLYIVRYPGSSPCKRIVSLIPVSETATLAYTRRRSVRSTQLEEHSKYGSIEACGLLDLRQLDDIRRRNQRNTCEIR